MIRFIHADMLDETRSGRPGSDTPHLQAMTRPAGRVPDAIAFERNLKEQGHRLQKHSEKRARSAQRGK